MDFRIKGGTMWTDTSLSPRISGSVLAHYALAVAAVLTALLVCRGLHLIAVDNLPYGVILFPAVAFAALYCGVGPSIVTIILGLVGAIYWFIPPTHSFHLPNAAQSIGLLAFLFASGTVVAMGEGRRRHNEKLRTAQGALEDRVQERTAELDTANRSLRELSARLLQLQDDERRRIARELHDSVGQMLAALTMNLSAVRADVERLAATAANLTDSEGLVQEMSKEVRTISHLLHPPLLDEAGLASALRWYVEGFSQRSKIKVDLDLPDDFGRLPRESETAVFRMVQECLTNIHRHSGSSTATIRIRHLDGDVLVEVEDRGKGIPPEKRDEMASAGTPGVGIRGMRERLRQLGGTLEIDSNGTGTVVVARLPVNEPPSTVDRFLIPDTSSTAAV
jgi:signal transduction histidine kinase